MEYRVYNERNIKVLVTDQQLEEAIKKSGIEAPVEIISAMGITREKRYIPRLCEALDHKTQRVRIEAVFSLLSINDDACIEELRNREKNILNSELNDSISEKAILKAALIRIEEGAEGAKKAFFSGMLPSKVKAGLLYNYSSNIPLNDKDVEFIILALVAYINKSEPWMLEIKRDDYEDVIIICLEGLVRAANESNILGKLPSEFNEKLCKVGSQILRIKIDSYAKELIAEFARALPPKIAYKMLEPIMNGSARGDVRKELNISLQVLHQKEEDEDQTNGT